MDDKLRDGQLEQYRDFLHKEDMAEKCIVLIYARCLIEYKKYIARLFEDCEEDGKLTYDEMTKYGRLGKLDEALKSLTISLYSENTKEISSALKNSYTDGFNGTSEIIHAWGNKSLIPIMRDEEMQRALTNEISGLSWTSRMGINRETAVNKIRETLVRGLYEGETYAQMAKRLDDALGKAAYGSIRIVRTESARIFSQARKDRLDKVKGVEKKKEWITSDDEKVRSNHSPMHGVKIAYEDEFILPNGNMGFAPCMIGAAEDDIGCRCFWIVDFID